MRQKRMGKFRIKLVSWMLTAVLLLTGAAVPAVAAETDKAVGTTLKLEKTE